MSCEECGSPFDGSHFGDCRIACGWQPAQEFQHYWRCEHYPSALENFQNDRAPCGICTEPPTWWSNGANRKPKSWGGHFDIGV